MGTQAQELLDTANGLLPSHQNIKIFPVAYKHLQELEEKARNHILNIFEKKLNVKIVLDKKTGHFDLEFEDKDRANKEIIEDKIKKIRNALSNFEGLIRSRDAKKIFKRLEVWLSSSEERAASSANRDKKKVKNEEFNKVATKEKPQYMEPLKARFPYQQPIIDALNNDRGYTLIEGQAATGKTYLAVRYAIQQLKTGKRKKIVLIRPAVEAGEKLGFMPGGPAEKVSPFMEPFFDIMDEIGLTNKEIQDLITTGAVKILPLAHTRGKTLRNSIVICDESQNATKAQLKMVMGRIDSKSRVIFTGSRDQQDITGPQDFANLVEFFERNDLGNNIKIPDGVESCRHPDFQKIVEAEKREAAEALLGINHAKNLENTTTQHFSNGSGHAHSNGHTFNGNGHGSNGHYNGNGHTHNGTTLTLGTSFRRLVYPESNNKYDDYGIGFGFGHDDEHGPSYTPD